MHYTRAYTKQHYDISVIVSKIDMKDKASDVQKQDYEANITNCVHKVLGTKGKHFEMTILKKTEDIKRNKAGMPIVKEQLHLVHIQEIYEWIIEKIEEKKLV
jgi:hypothetical protein